MYVGFWIWRDIEKATAFPRTQEATTYAANNINTGSIEQVASLTW